MSFIIHIFYCFIIHIFYFIYSFGLFQSLLLKLMIQGLAGIGTFGAKHVNPSLNNGDHVVNNGDHLL